MQKVGNILKIMIDDGFLASNKFNNQYIQRNPMMPSEVEKMEILTGSSLYKLDHVTEML